MNVKCKQCSYDNIVPSETDFEISANSCVIVSDDRESLLITGPRFGCERGVLKEKESVDEAHTGALPYRRLAIKPHKIRSNLPSMIRLFQE